MIKAYLVGISSLYEGEDIEVRYRIYENQELVSKESILMEYRKPAIVGQVALITLLVELERYRSQEIVIIVNDSRIYEIIRGTYKTKNKDILNMAKQIREELSKFANCMIKDVSVDHVELAKWKEVLKP